MTKCFCFLEELSSESLQFIEQFRSSLRENRSYLIDNIRYDVLSDWLLKHEVFSDAHMEFIEEVKTRRARVTRMIDIFFRRSTKDYQMFLTCLKSCRHQHVATLLENGGG